MEAAIVVKLKTGIERTGVPKKEIAAVFLPMPAAASRAEADKAELYESGSTSITPQQTTDADRPPKPLENGKPRRWAEFGIAATSVIFILLSMVPRELKKGQMWYTAAHSLLLVSTLVLIASLFWGNTHIKMIRFLSGKPIFVQVVALTLIDWLQVMIMPDPGSIIFCSQSIKVKTTTCTNIFFPERNLIILMWVL